MQQISLNSFILRTLQNLPSASFPRYFSILSLCCTSTDSNISLTPTSLCFCTCCFLCLKHPSPPHFHLMKDPKENSLQHNWTFWLELFLILLDKSFPLILLDKSFPLTLLPKNFLGSHCITVIYVYLLCKSKSSRQLGTMPYSCLNFQNTAHCLAG